MYEQLWFATLHCIDTTATAREYCDEANFIYCHILFIVLYATLFDSDSKRITPPAELRASVRRRKTEHHNDRA